MLAKIAIYKQGTTTGNNKYGTLKYDEEKLLRVCKANVGTLSDEKRVTLGYAKREMLSCLVNYSKTDNFETVEVLTGPHKGKYSIANKKVIERKTLLYLEKTNV